MGGFAAGLSQGLEQARDRQIQAQQLQLQQDMAKYQMKAMESEDQMRQLNIQSLLKRVAAEQALPGMRQDVLGPGGAPLGPGQEGPQAPPEVDRAKLASFLQAAGDAGQDPNKVLELMAIGDPRIAAIKDSLRPPEMKVLHEGDTLVQVGGKQQPQPQQVQAPQAPAPAQPKPVNEDVKYQANLERGQALDQARNTPAGEAQIDFAALDQRNPAEASFPDWGTGGIAPPAPQAPAAPPPQPQQPAGPAVQVLAKGQPKRHPEDKPLVVPQGSTVLDPKSGQPMFQAPQAPPKPPDFGDRVETAAAIFLKSTYGIDGGTMSQLINIDPISAEKVRQKALVDEPTIIAGAKQQQNIKNQQEELLTPEEANKLAVPYGTKKKDAAGLMPLTSVQRESLASYDTARIIIDDIDQYSKKVNTAAGGAMGRLEQGSKLWGALTQSDPDAAMLQSKAGELARLARSMGEKGAMAEGDIARSAALVPGVTDTKEVAMQKIKDLKALIDNAEGAFRTSVGMKPRPANSGSKKAKEPIQEDPTTANIPVPKNLTPKQQEIFKQEYLKKRQEVQGKMQSGVTAEKKTPQPVSP